MGPPIVSLDKRIAAALAETEHELADLKALVDETTQTIGSVEAEHTHCMARSLDPTVVDEEAKGRADKAAHMLARLNNALPRLQALLNTALAAERLAAWNADLAALQVTRDKLADRFRTRYCEVAAELIEIFDAMAALDQQVDELNSRANAAGARQRMRSTEACARGIDGFTAGTKSILEEIKLPGFGLGSGEVKAVWPRPKVPWNIAYAASMAAMMQPRLDPQLQAEVEAEGGFEGGGYERVMKRRQREERERVAEFYRKREEGREALDAAERQRLHEAAMERRRLGM
jgi:hypothetical protein